MDAPHFPRQAKFHQVRDPGFVRQPGKKQGKGRIEEEIVDQEEDHVARDDPIGWRKEKSKKVERIFVSPFPRAPPENSLSPEVDFVRRGKEKRLTLQLLVLLKKSEYLGP
jgi:hypothetical protein